MRPKLKTTLRLKAQEVPRRLKGSVGLAVPMTLSMIIVLVVLGLTIRMQRRLLVQRRGKQSV